ncbi:MAG: hypothetical protein P4L53_03935 [Candidatus Obscuribacterales bacterium]|nr:hypothetical protein [Candidatus Obscuribacterales bacterium]
MTLIDEFLDQITPPAKVAKFCIDEIAKDRGEDVATFREAARRSLHIPGAGNVEDVDHAFMESVKNGIADKEGQETAESRIDKFQRDRHCR